MKHIDLFDLIAPVYALFYKHQRKGYRRSLDILFSHENYTGFKGIDVGCGTGALSAELASHLSIKGVDGSAKMINEAKKLNPSLDFEVINFDQGLPFADHSTQLVFSSFVLHGISSQQRLLLLKEMKRIASEAVIILDYHKGYHPFISLIEWVEHGDYFNFMKHFEQEYPQIFEHSKIIKINEHTALYILS
jgi:ubiquinone/menaquinone biosynthesis C-methylase UbiE